MVRGKPILKVVQYSFKVKIGFVEIKFSVFAIRSSFIVLLYHFFCMGLVILIFEIIFAFPQKANFLVAEDLLKKKVKIGGWYLILFG